MSQLKVNSIVPVGGLPAGASAGGIIQTVTASTTTSVSQSYSSEGSFQTTITDTGLSASITPSSNSSKILVMVRQQYAFGYDSDSDLQVHYNFVVRNSSNTILHGAIGYGSEGAMRYKSLKAFYQYYTTTFVHSPSTTSSYTYKLGMNAYRMFGGTTTMYAQLSGNESHITLMELTG
tara:strand:+ start:171 stop:701 length:531 start_codon:yes stop_codon:yes gene_type:complete